MSPYTRPSTGNPLPAPRAPEAPAAKKRRVPTQTRSRQRVERLLDATAELVLEDGVDSLSTRTIADRAGMPVASLYQYFADRDAVLLALVERDVEEMDAQVDADLKQLSVVSISAIVEATMRAFVKVYHRRPAFVEIYLRGRTNAAIMAFCREHNHQMADNLHAQGIAAGLLRPETDPLFVRLAVEIGDRIFQVAFEHEITGDEALIDEGIKVVSGYLVQYET